VGTPDECALIRTAIEQGGRDDLERIVTAVRRTGALEYTRECARRESKAATDRIASLADSACKDSLLQLAHFSVERKF
jgi:octaprenyl-diphosphate synthase